jgi:hypothetical protein
MLAKQEKESARDAFQKYQIETLIKKQRLRKKLRSIEAEEKNSKESKRAVVINAPSKSRSHRTSKTLLDKMRVQHRKELLLRK